MSPSYHIAGGEVEMPASGLNSQGYATTLNCSFKKSRVLAGNEVGNNGVLLPRAPLQTASIIPPLPPDAGVANEADLTSGTIRIQIDEHAVLPGALQTPTLQQNAFGIPMVSHGTPPTPNDHHVQTQIPNGTATGQALYNENAPYGGELTNLLTGQQVAAFNHKVRENEVEMLRRKMIESSLLIVSQVFVTLSTAWLGNSNLPLSRNTKILRDFAVGSTILGYISAFSSILMCKLSTSLPARILNTIAYAGAAFGFIATMGMLLPDELKLWVTALACTVCFPALAAGFHA